MEGVEGVRGETGDQEKRGVLWSSQVAVPLPSGGFVAGVGGQLLTQRQCCVPLLTVYVLHPTPCRDSQLPVSLLAAQVPPR